MRTTKFYHGLFLVLTLSLMSIDCDEDPVIVEGDMEGPEITIINPDDNDIFYVEDGVDTPKYVILEANATDDDSSIVIGSATVYNSSGEQVYYYDETSGSQNGASITTIYSSFRTDVPGEYRIEFEFEDAAGNSSIITRIVTCLPSESDLPS